jgi:hypothetical protein
LIITKRMPRALGGLHVPDLVSGLGHANQGLARHAACPRAVGADTIALDQQHACAQLRGKPGGDQAACSGTDDHEVIGATTCIIVMTRVPTKPPSAARANVGCVSISSPP